MDWGPTRRRLYSILYAGELALASWTIGELNRRQVDWIPSDHTVKYCPLIWPIITHIQTWRFNVAWHYQENELGCEVLTCACSCQSAKHFLYIFCKLKQITKVMVFTSGWNGLLFPSAIKLFLYTSKSDLPAVFTLYYSCIFKYI